VTGSRNSGGAGVGAGRGHIYRSAALAVALLWSVRLIGIVSVLALARLLQPADFGVIAVALTASALIEAIGWIGLGEALLRIRKPEPAHYDTAFTLQLIIFGSLAALMLAVVAPLAASFYDFPVLRLVLSVLSFRLLCIAFTNIGIVDFERNFQFERDLKMRVGARFASLAVTIAAALILRNYWALVVGMISQSAFHTIASYLAHPYRPRLSLSKRSDLLAVSGWIFVSTLAGWLQREIERLVLGRFATTHIVGLYSTSKELAMMFTQEISTALNRVSFVTVAGAERPMRDSPAGIAVLMGAYATIAAPLAAGLAAVAEDAIVVLLGAKWIAAMHYLQIAAIYTGMQAVYHVVTSVLQGSGQVKRAALLNIGTALLLASTVIGAAMAWRSAEAVAYSALCASLIIMLIYIIVLARALAVKAATVAAHILRPVAAAGVMFLTVTEIAHPNSGSPFFDLLIAVAVGAPAYVAASLAIWFLCGRPDGSESEALAMIRSFLARRQESRLARHPNKVLAAPYADE
jgi:O-antigen/teichoic acid export membrane protein